MKVLQIIDTLHIGGAEKMLVVLSNLLSARDIETEVLLINNGGPLLNELDKHIKVHHLNRKNKYSPVSLRKAHKLCVGFDIVHVHMRHCYAYIKLAQIMFGGGYKIILHDHYGDININRQVPYSLRGVFKPRYYIGVSQALVSWAKSELKVNSTHCHLLINTVMIQPLAFKKPRRGKAMMVSNIRPTKNIEFAISLLGKELTIYGNKENEGYFETIQQLCKQSGAEIQQGISNLAKEYGKYDIAIHTSRSETGPLVLLEYMVAGIPFLAYETGAVAEFLANELPMYFVKSFNREEWLSKIKAINAIDDHSYLKTMFDKYFSPEKYISNCLSIYASVNS